MKASPPQKQLRTLNQAAVVLAQMKKGDAARPLKSHLNPIKSRVVAAKF
jgi:DTW domain-containing protein YfiP